LADGPSVETLGYCRDVPSGQGAKPIRRRVLSCLAVALAILLPACSTTPKVHTQSKPGADYTRYHTFALMPLPTAGPASDPGLMLRVAEPARQAVVQALEAKGVTEADRAQADIAVNLRGQSLPKVEVNDYGFHYPVYTRAGRVEVVRNPSPYPTVSTYDERTLTVEIYDNKSKDLVWAGWCMTKASGPVDPVKLQEGIRKILEGFPPLPKTP